MCPIFFVIWPKKIFMQWQTICGKTIVHVIILIFLYSKIHLNQLNIKCLDLTKKNICSKQKSRITNILFISSFQPIIIHLFQRFIIHKIKIPNLSSTPKLFHLFSLNRFTSSFIIPTSSFQNKEEKNLMKTNLQREEFTDLGCN